jgi:hypothetical protein
MLVFRFEFGIIARLWVLDSLIIKKYKVCRSEWSDVFVLVEYPEDTCCFENEGIGYPCFNSEDNGACYVPEYDYIKYYRKCPSKEKYFNPVPWPDSQEYMDNPECEAIIADEKGLEDFGSSAYWVPLVVSQCKNNNL